MTIERLNEYVGQSPTVDTVAIGAGALAHTAEAYQTLFGSRSAVLFADENTWQAAGARTQAVLEEAGVHVRAHILSAQPRPKPSRELAEALAQELQQGETPVAVGSGVINDLVKYAAFATQRPYLCVATAASMDGYTSSGAPLTDKGFKKTIECRPPQAIIADLDVIADAPAAMAGWGFGDMAGKIPAGADWIIADALAVDPIVAAPWSMVQDDLRDWLAGPETLRAGDRAQLAKLFTGLAMVGLAMERHAGSRPASGADHQIAHMWEMGGLMYEGERVSHGACVSVGTVASLRLYDWVLRQDLSALDVEAAVAAAPTLDAKRAEIDRVFDTAELARRSVVETCAKHAEPDALRARLTRLVSVWPNLRERLKAQIVTPQAMVQMLHAAGAPALPAEIGVPAEQMRRTVEAARFMRSRYTIFDLLEECGLLADALNAVFPVPARVEG